MSSIENMKKQSAEKALSFISSMSVIGVGTGSTTNYFIDALSSVKNKIEGAVSSSKKSERKLKSLGIQILQLNDINELPVYIDGADEIDSNLQMIKGGGGALTSEKIIASVAKKYICIADKRKLVKVLGKFPVAVEVIPMARSFVARELVKIGGMPVYREGMTTDHGNVILDVHNLKITNAAKLEETINNIPGVVTNGIFAKRPADVLLIADETGVKEITNGKR